MSGTDSRQVIVGIDGSEQAERAAVWAIDEAAGRDATLHLIYVIRTDLSGTLTAGEYESAVSAAKEAMTSVRERIDRRGASVAVTTTITQGSPAGVLLAESRDAEIICLGWTGLNRFCVTLMGSTAMSVAAKAACPVAVVRTTEDGKGPAPQTRWIIVPVGADTRRGDTLVTDAVQEARCRDWPMLVLWTDAGKDRTRVEAVNLAASHWRQDFPDVHIYPVVTEHGLAQFLHASPEVGGLVMLDGDSCPDVPSVINRVGRAEPVELAVVVTHSGTSLGRSGPAA